MEAGATLSDEIETSGNDGTSRRRRHFASLVLLDFESTGLSRKCGVTELCLLSVQAHEIRACVTPRAINKLLLCFNPKCAVEFTASNLTGLCNDTLEQLASFSEQTPLICSFLESQPQPVCLVAHNGSGFDFPLLQAELRKARRSRSPDDQEAFSFLDQVYCVDSLPAFRVMDGLPPIPEWLIPKNRRAHAKRKSTDVSPSGDVGPKSAVSSPGASLSVSDGGMKATLCEEAGKMSEKSKSGHQVGNNASGDSSSSKRCAESDSSVDSTRFQKSIKIAKCDSAAIGFDSQQSVSDDQLMEAYDLAVGQNEEGGGDGGWKGTFSTMQAEQEASPAAVTLHVVNINAAHQLEKKQNPFAIKPSDRQRVTRRLFDDQDSTPSVQGRLSSNNSDVRENTIVDSLAVSASNSSTSILFDENLTGNEEQNVNCAGSNVENMILNPDPQLSSSQSNEKIPFPSNSSSSIGGSTPSSAKKLSYKLDEIYCREFGCRPESSHTAEDDCISLLRLIAKRSTQFLEFVEENAFPLASVEPRY